MKQNHYIEKVTVEINVGSEEEALDINSNINDYVKDYILPEIESQINSIASLNKSESLQINKVSLSITDVENSLKNLSSGNSSLMLGLSSRIGDSFNKVITAITEQGAPKVNDYSLDPTTNVENTVTKSNLVTPEQKKINAFTHFLASGQQAWWADELIMKSIFTLEFINGIVINEKTRNLITRTLKNPKARKRLVLQFSNTYKQALFNIIIPNTTHKITLEDVTKIAALSPFFQTIFWQTVFELLTDNTLWNDASDAYASGSPLVDLILKQIKENHQQFTALSLKGSAHKKNPITHSEKKKNNTTINTPITNLDNQKNNITSNTPATESDNQKNNTTANTPTTKPDNPKNNTTANTPITNPDNQKNNTTANTPTTSPNNPKNNTTTNSPTINTNEPINKSILETPVTQKTDVIIDRLFNNIPTDGITNSSEKFNDILFKHVGLLLLHPFLKHFLKKLDLLSPEGQLTKPEYTVHLLHYIVTGNTQQPENEMCFEKYLCNIPLEEPIDSFITIELNHMEEVNLLFDAVRKNWSAMKKSSIDLLRNEFLQRPGKLLHTDEGIKIVVERKSFDLLMEKMDWGIGLIKLPWLTSFIYVKW